MKLVSRIDAIIHPIMLVLEDSVQRRPIRIADDIVRLTHGKLRPEVRDVVKALALMQRRGLVRPDRQARRVPA